jgi:galactokinase
VFVVRAPGRVNLIGDHTDYQDGFCLPLAIDREVVVRAEPRDDGLVVATSDALEGVVELPADGIAEPRTVEPRWGGTLAAVLSLLSQPDRVAVGFTAEVTSTVPVGSGLSSSAAFAVAAVIAATHATGDRISPDSVAWIAREAEQAASGVPCGVMDQITSVFGRAGHALLLDCRSLTVVPVAIPSSIAILVVHTGVARRLADSAYGERRDACVAAAARAGVQTLRDAPLARVGSDPFARHVVSENQRVLDFVDALGAGDFESCGRLMTASHASLRDDFRVSTPELDALVDALLRAGAYGARLTGAGFGGCAVAMIPAAAVDDIVARTIGDYRSATGLVPTPFVVQAVDGAEVESNGLQNDGLQRNG